MMDGEPELPPKGPWNSDEPREWDRVIPTRMHSHTDGDLSPAGRESFCMPGGYNFEGINLEFEEPDPKSQVKGPKV